MKVLNFLLIFLFLISFVNASNVGTNLDYKLEVSDNSDTNSIYENELKILAKFTKGGVPLENSKCVVRYSYNGLNSGDLEMIYDSSIQSYKLEVGDNISKGYVWYIPYEVKSYQVECDGLIVSDNLNLKDYREPVATQFENLKPGLPNGVVYDEFNKFSKYFFSALRDPLYFNYSGSDLKISSIWSHTSETSFVVAFETNLPTFSYVEYGETLGYGFKTDFSERTFYNHRIYLKNLKKDTTYHYRIVVIDELGRKKYSEDKTFKTFTPQNVVYIKDLPGGPNYVLDQSNTYYLLTEDIVSNETAIYLDTVANVTVDLGGNTIIFGQGNSENAYGIDYFNYPYIDGYIRIFNGKIIQGENPNMYSNSDSSKFSPVIIRDSKYSKNNHDRFEMAGIEIEYYASQSWGFLSRYSWGKYRIHHNSFKDVGVGVTNRHGAGTRAQGFLYLDVNNENELKNNVVKRTRQSGINGAKNIENNEIYIDSWAANSFGIQSYNPKDGIGGGITSNNKVFGTGYYAIAIPWATINQSFDNNFIHMEAINTKDYRWWESWGEQNVVNGFRLTQYNPGGQYRNNVDFDGNIVITNARHGGYARGTEFFSDNSVYNWTFRNSILKAVAWDNNGDVTTVATQGHFRKNDTQILKYINITSISNRNNIRLGDSYGKGNNHHFINSTFIKIGDNPNYHTFIGDGGYWNYGHLLLNPTFLGGAKYNDVYWERTATLTDYSIGWTVNINSNPNSEIIILDKDGKESFKGNLNNLGKLSVDLKELTIRPSNWNLDEVRSAEPKDSHLEVKYSPYTFIAIDGNKMDYKVVDVNSKKTITLNPNLPLNSPPKIKIISDSNTLSLPKKLDLEAIVQDESSINSGTWEKVYGPGDAIFDDLNSLKTKVTFTKPGSYLIRFKASDSQFTTSSDYKIVAEPQDFEKPKVSGVLTLFDNTSITIMFSEKINKTEALNKNNYIIPGIEINEVTVSEDGKYVSLKVVGLEKGKNYELTVKGVHDLAYVPNEIDSSIKTNFKFTRSAFINFQPKNYNTPNGYFGDEGGVYSNKGPGIEFGWTKDISENTRNRGSGYNPDPRYATLIHMSYKGLNASWKMLVPNGFYRIKVVAGDSQYPDGISVINVEDKNVVNFTLSKSDRHREGTVLVEVKDNILDLYEGPGASISKINFIEIEPVNISNEIPENVGYSPSETNETNVSNSEEVTSNESNESINSGNVINNEQVSTSDSSSSSSGNSGSSGSSNNKNEDSSKNIGKSIIDVKSNSIKDDLKCIPLYEKKEWTDCVDGFQKREIIDLNGCFDNEVETRICKNYLDENEIKFLNSKDIKVSKINDNVYKTKLSGGYNEIVRLSDDVLKDKFLLINEVDGQEYLATVVETREDGTYYSLKRVDEEVMNELKEEGIVETPLSENLSNTIDETYNSENFWRIIIVVLILLIITSIFGVRFYIKKHHESNSNFEKFKNSSEDNLENSQNFENNENNIFNNQNFK
jgi:hypothetical protein